MVMVGKSMRLKGGKTTLCDAIHVCDESPDVVKNDSLANSMNFNNDLMNLNLAFTTILKQVEGN